jgi:hypothetical protein
VEIQIVQVTQAHRRHASVTIIVFGCAPGLKTYSESAVFAGLPLQTLKAS